MSVELEQQRSLAAFEEKAVIIRAVSTLKKVREPNAEECIDPFEKALLEFHKALQIAARRDDNSDVIKHALRIEEQILKIRQNAPKMLYSVYHKQSTKDAELIQHLSSTAELLKADEPTVKQVQTYKQSAHAIHGFDGAKALKGAMFAFVGALTIAAGLTVAAIGVVSSGATLGTTMVAGGAVGSSLMYAGFQALKHGVGLFAGAVRGKDAVTENSAAVLASRPTSPAA